MKPHPTLAPIAVLVVVSNVLMTACGGGGGDPPAPPPPASINAAAANRNLLTASNTWTVSGRGSDNLNYVVTVAVAPASAGVFAVTGMSTARSVTTTSGTVSGVAIPASTSTVYFNSADASLVGVDNGDGTCDVATANSALPTSASVGQSGPVASIEERNGCTAGAAKIGSYTATWSLETDGPVTLFCQNTTHRDLASALTGTEADCIEVAASGTLGARARVSITFTSPAFSLVAKNY